MTKYVTIEMVIVNTNHLAADSVASASAARFDASYLRLASSEGGSGAL